MDTSQLGFHPTCTFYVDTWQILLQNMVAFLNSATKVRWPGVTLNCQHIYVMFIGVEKLNDDCKRMYFRSSNKHNPTVDMIKKKYKLIRLQRTCERRKRTYA